ncbi:hypothetical protein [Rosistilla oblonga]|uniref:Uncharacterized protein n=1 Tax=Rosistilla oblonga TaxID=2527990 RepID=A0A518IYZ9_9BACT|nr:hypothetical protein [Rosistilla oblonga]QDV58308.1 hypothetical protein Mal33_43260 [Rosistilla oblonga]
MNLTRTGLSILLLSFVFVAGCQEQPADPNDNYTPTPDIETPSPGGMESTPTPS